MQKLYTLLQQNRTTEIVVVSMFEILPFQSCDSQKIQVIVVSDLGKLLQNIITAYVLLQQERLSNCLLSCILKRILFFFTSLVYVTSNMTQFIKLFSKNIYISTAISNSHAIQIFPHLIFLFFFSSKNCFTVPQ